MQLLIYALTSIQIAVEIGTWMSNYIPNKTMDVITYPCSNIS